MKNVTYKDLVLVDMDITFLYLLKYDNDWSGVISTL